MIKHINEVPAFVIVIKNHNTSEFYHRQAKVVWESLGINAKVFNAITPETIPESSLVFHKNYAYKYSKIGGKEFTETEKACFYSHFSLWNKCVELNQKILVLEHDNIPFNPKLLFFDDEVWFKSFDIGAMGCYIIDPFFAKLAINRALEQGVCSGPLGELQHFFCGSFKNSEQSFIVKEGRFFYNTVSNNYICATTQIYHESYDTSIKHGDHEPNKIWPLYIRIENAPDPLNMSWIQEQALKFEYGRKSLNC
jgi:hypothetical protein